MKWHIVRKQFLAAVNLQLARAALLAAGGVLEAATGVLQAVARQFGL